MRKIFFILFACVSSVQAWAVTVPHLYQASYPVASQQVSRSSLFSKGLAEVLVKVSGNSQVVTLPPVKLATAQAGNYVDQYFYQKSSEPEQQLLLTMRFSEVAINQLLRANDQAIWGSDRPLTLVWLVVKNGTSLQLISSEEVDDSLAKVLMTDANARGFPLEWPMMDLTDMQLVSANDILQDNVLAVENASKRYLPNAILMVLLDKTNPTAISSDWTLLFQGQQQQWHAEGATVSEALQVGLNDVVDAIATKYAVKETPANQQAVELQVNHVNSIARFAEVNRYLAQLTGVAHVQVTNVQEGLITFKLQINSSLQALLAQIKLGKRLLPVSQYGEADAQQTRLIFQYTGT